MEELSSDLLLLLLNFLVDTRQFAAVNKKMRMIYKNHQDYIFYTTHKLTLQNIYGFARPKLLEMIGCGCDGCMSSAPFIGVNIKTQLYDGFMYACDNKNIDMIKHLLCLKYIWSSNALFASIYKCIKSRNIYVLNLLIDEVFFIPTQINDSTSVNTDVIVLSYDSFDISYMLRISPTHDDKIMYTYTKKPKKIEWVSFLLAELCISHIFELAEKLLKKYKIYQVGVMIIYEHILHQGDHELLEFASKHNIITGHNLQQLNRAVNSANTFMLQ